MSVQIETDDGPRCMSDVLNDWQTTDHEAVDGALQRVARRKVTAGRPVHREIWLGRPRGHSKNRCCILGHLRPVRVDAAVRVLHCGRSRSKAAAVARQGFDVHRLVSMLAKVLIVSNWERGCAHRQRAGCAVVGRGDVLRDHARFRNLRRADALGAEQRLSLWQSLVSSAAKRRACLFVVMSDAGFVIRGSYPCAERFERIPIATFTSWTGLARAGSTTTGWPNSGGLLPEPAFRRLWLNQWSTGSSDLLADTEIEACDHLGRTV